MKHLKLIFGFIALLGMSGCASINTEAGHNDCHIALGVVGAGIGGLAANVPGAAGGTALGALLGKFLCGDGAAAPAPAPEEDISGNFLVPDGDNDGVRDEYDLCPNTPEGVAVEDNGCARDNDGDGVPDYLDECPETPLGSAVDLRGCSALIASLKGVHFAFDSANLTMEAKGILDGAAATMNAHPSGNFVIEGHTDSTGSDSYNMSLSQRRAESVMNYLASRGVSSSSMRAVGKGESSPVADNSTSAGRADNRRVEIYAK